MLRKISLIGLTIIMLFLIACQSDDNGATSEVTKENNDTEETVTEQEPTEELEVETEETPGLDASSLFEKMADAVKTVTSISGVALTHTTESGEPREAKRTFVLKTILDPFIFHANITFEDDEGNSEWYANDSEMYMFIDEIGWIKTDEPMMVDITKNQYTEAHFQHFMKHADLFDVSEKDDHYVVTYIGGDDHFKEVFYNEEILKDVTKNAQALLEMVGNSEYTGDIKLKIAKDTLLMMEHEATIHSVTNAFGMMMESSDHTVHTFTYNDVEPFDIPEDVKNSAIDSGMNMFKDFNLGDIDFGDIDFSN